MHRGDFADKTGRDTRHPQKPGAIMPTIRKSIIAIGLAAVAALAGCASDHTPEGYHRMRPEVTEISTRDRGLQSSEVVEASEKLAAEILSLPEVNQSSRRLTVVFTGLEDLTRRRQIDYNIFLERLKTEISYKGRDRIAIVTNRDTFYRTRSAELDAPRGAERDVPPAANRIQPDFSLQGKVMDLPNRGTDYYLFTFSLADIRSDGGGTEIPLRYEVRVRK
jgi:hypothetical protein